jgi:hypothetical protein
MKKVFMVVFSIMFIFIIVGCAHKEVKKDEVVRTVLIDKEQPKPVGEQEHKRVIENIAPVYNNNIVINGTIPTPAAVEKSPEKIVEKEAPIVIQPESQVVEQEPGTGNDRMFRIISSKTEIINRRKPIKVYPINVVSPDDPRTNTTYTAEVEYQCSFPQTGRITNLLTIKSKVSGKIIKYWFIDHYNYDVSGLDALYDSCERNY